MNRSKLPYYYESFAVSPSAAVSGAAYSFYSSLDRLFPFERDPSTGALVRRARGAVP